MAYFGIDCAQWQGVIDWGKVKKDGVKFAILKVTQKNNAVEKAFERNYAGCAKQGIPVGVYRYVYAKTAAAATAEAKAIVSVLKGRKAPCGVWLDMEDTSLRKLGKSALTAVIAAERKVLEAAGYQVGVYCNQDWYSNVLDVDKLDLPFWIARYGSNNGKQQTKPSVKSRHTLWGWQYSSVGRVSGISGSVDVNVAYFAPGAFGGSKVYTRPMVRKGDLGEAVPGRHCGPGQRDRGVYGQAQVALQGRRLRGEVHLCGHEETGQARVQLRPLRLLGASGRGAAQAG